jgi:PhnB protein
MAAAAPLSPMLIAGLETSDKEFTMARVSTYLNFARETEAAFLFYREVFGGEFNGPIHRFSDSPGCPGQDPVSPEDGNLVMHVELVILGGHVLMGTDAPASMGFTLVQGNSSYLNLEPDSRAETDCLFAALAEDGKVEVELQEMFWGDYFGSLVDKFGTHWMFNCRSKE